MDDDETARPLPSGFEVVTPRGVQQWVGDSAGSASRAPGALRSVLGDVGNDHVRVLQGLEEQARAMQASSADECGEDPVEVGQAECIPQRIAYNIPSTLNLGQTLLWISTSIGGHLSRAQLEREMRRFWSHDARVEPPLALVIACLRDGHLDPLSADQRPTISAEATFEEARDQLRDALRGGKVTMRGQPSDPSNTAEALSQYQCEQIIFSEDQHGIARSVIASKPERFWECLRFTSSEIMDLWPVPDAVTIENTPEKVNAPAQEVEVETEATNGDKVEPNATLPLPPLSAIEDRASKRRPEQVRSPEEAQGTAEARLENCAEHAAPPLVSDPITPVGPSQADKRRSATKTLQAGLSFETGRKKGLRSYPFSEALTKELGKMPTRAECLIEWDFYKPEGKRGRPKVPAQNATSR